jgi:hypothetical protein
MRSLPFNQTNKVSAENQNFIYEFFALSGVVSVWIKKTDRGEMFKG